jgi:outer membrane protein TolC
MIALLLSSVAAVAQSPQMRPDSTIKDIRQRLIELALPGPDMEIADRNEIIAQQQLQRSKRTIMNQLIVTGNLNEFSIKGSQPTQNQANLFPRYNIGLQLPLGVMFTRAKDIRVAEQNVAIAHAERSKTYGEIKAIILKNYEDFLMYSALLDVQTKSTSAEYLNFLKVESDFENGAATEDAYNDALKKYNEEMTKKINTQRNREIARIEIEKYILVPLDDVIKGLR